MIASDARIAANRANAAKSTGPKTPEGKERSRGNAVKHGLTGAGVALGREEAEAVEARARGFEDSYRPATDAGRELVRRAAMLSVRLDRCAARETAAIEAHVRAAGADFDEARHSEVDALFGGLADDPAAAVRRLLRKPEGVDRLVAAWRDLRYDLTHGDGTRWQDGHGQLAIRLTGRKPGGMGCSRVEALLAARRHNFDHLGPEDGAGLEGRARRDWAMRELATLIEAEVRKLEAHRATLDHESIAADRAGAADRALFDPSKEATLARKYEAAAEREMHRALKEMRAVEAEAASRPEPEPAAAPTPAVPLGSFSRATVPESVGDASAPPAARPGPDEGPGRAPTTPQRPEERTT